MLRDFNKTSFSSLLSDWVLVLICWKKSFSIPYGWCTSIRPFGDWLERSLCYEYV